MDIEIGDYRKGIATWSLCLTRLSCFSPYALFVLMCASPFSFFFLCLALPLYAILQTAVLTPHSRCFHSFLSVFVWAYLCTCICAFLCAYFCASLYACLCACLCACLYACLCYPSMCLSTLNSMRPAGLSFSSFTPLVASPSTRSYSVYLYLSNYLSIHCVWSPVFVPLCSQPLHTTTLLVLLSKQHNGTIRHCFDKHGSVFSVCFRLCMQR